VSEEGSIAQRLLGRCEQLAGAELTYPFGPSPAVYKVAGRMFALFGGDDPVGAPVSVSLKCEPEHGTNLVVTYPGISRGYHLNKRHWITVDLSAELSAELLVELVEDSYDLVAEKARPRLRPRTAAQPGDDQDVSA
jgi:predicted DNA-binding protein (MmcQ/YjbR family)